MTSSPEDVKSLPESVKNARPEITEVGLNGNTEPLPPNNNLLVKTEQETQTRKRLLESLTIDANGVAFCLNDADRQDTMVAAVIVDGDGKANQIPLRLLETGTLLVELPDGQPTQIGFFVGRLGNKEMSAVLRTDSYPGVPVSTRLNQNQTTQEVLYTVSGIGPREKDERDWAQQIGLFDKLGFEPSKTRGFSKKSPQPNPKSSLREEQSLITKPGLNEFQILLFEPKLFSQSDETSTDGQTPDEQPERTIAVNSLEGAFKIIAIESRNINLLLHDSALRKMQARIDELGLGSRYPYLEPENIFSPRIITKNLRTVENLWRAGLSQKLNVIYISQSQVKDDSLYVSSATSYDYKDASSKQNGGVIPITDTVYQDVTLSSEDIFKAHQALVLSVKSPKRGVPTVNGHFTELDNPFAQIADQEIPLRSPDPRNDSVLLLVDDGKDKIHVSSLELPRGWKQLFRNGKFVDKPDQMPTSSDPFTEPMHTMAKLIASNEYSNDAFFEIRKKLEALPKSDMVKSADVRVATLAKSGTKAEINISQDRLGLILSGLDTGKLQEYCQMGQVDITALGDCFSNRGNFINRLALTVSLDRFGEIKLDGQILKWSQALSRFIDATDDFPAGLKALICERAIILPYVLFNLRKDGKATIQSAQQTQNPGRAQPSSSAVKPQRQGAETLPPDLKAIRNAAKYIDQHLTPLTTKKPAQMGKEAYRRSKNRRKKK